MIFTNGIAVRPSGSDNYWPVAGTSVPWHLSQPIIDLAEQAERARWPILGTIGNAEHRKLHGDHTPWSADKERGVIYAIDLQPPNDFEFVLVALCKSSYDTSWIDYFNINHRQYGNDGVRRDWPSADGHFHCSVRKGFEDTHVTLIDDYVKWDGDDMEPTTAIGRPVSIPAYMKDYAPTVAYLLHGTLYNVLDLKAKTLAATAADEVRDRTTLAAITALTEALKAGGGASVDAATIVAAVRQEAQKTRDEVALRARHELAELAEAFKSASEST